MALVDWLPLGVPCATAIWSVATSALACMQARHPRHRREGRRDGPGVSVLVPVSAPASGLRSCVASLRRLKHDRIEILLLAAIDDRVAVQAVQRDAESAGTTTIRALVLRPLDSPNPKVGLLAAALRFARYDLLLFTDDNAISLPGRIRRHLERYDEDHQLVSAAAIGVRPEGFWGHVDAVFMNGYFARLQLAGDRIGVAGVSGKSMLIGRSDIERSGGLLPTGSTLCEDSALQKRVADIGGRTALSRQPVLQRVGRRTLGEVWSRHRRWFYCRRTQVPWVFASEAAVSSVVGSAFGALGTHSLGLEWWLGALVSAALLLGVEWVFLAVKGWPIGLWYPAAWIVREMLVLPLWLSALLGGTVRWRDRRLSLGR